MVAAVISSFGVAVPVTSAYAASLTGSAFEIDDNANLAVDGAGIDWLAGGSGSAMRTGVLVRDDRPSGQDDDSFTQGTNINDTPTTITTGSIPNNKSDLKNFGVYVDKQATETFVDVFWSRVQAPSGTTTMDFEFNQSSTRQNGISPPNNTDVDTHTIPLRTTGDILITYFLENGGTHPTLTKRTWTGSVWGAPMAFSASDALAAINTSAISAPLSDGVGPLDPFTFGEASMRLSAFVPATDTCLTFGSVYLRSRSSATDTDENKDFIAPEAVTISNCGSVKIHKTESLGNGPHTALEGAGFTLYKDVAPLGGASAGAEDKTVANAVGTCSTDSSGDCTIPNVKKGDYWLVETGIPAGHDGAADQPVSITAGDQEVSFTLDDPIQTGTITIIKNAVPDDAQDFDFSLDGAGFSLDDDADGTLPSTRSYVVPVGSHSVVEAANPSGWGLTSISCVDPTSNTTTSVPNRTASIALASGETVTCTFTNSFTVRDVNLQTQAATAAAGSWNDTATMTGDGIHAITGSVLFFACAAQSSATACTTGGTQVGGSAAVAHDSGASYSAATTVAYTPSAAGWTCFRAEFTSTSAFYASSNHTNATSECFLKQAQNLTVSKTAVAAFGRVYSWTIDKGVDDSALSIPAGGSASSHYTVTVGNTHVDGTWSVSGTITVSNPNPVAFTGVQVTDAINNGAGSCAVSGSPVTVPASGQAQLTYVCTYATPPSPSAGTNTATATWNAAAYFTPAGTASGTASVDFSQVTPSVTDESITVTDTVQGVLGTVNALTDPNPRLFTYTVDRSGVPGTCTSYPNTASFTSNDTGATGSSSKTVRICVGSDLTAGVTATGGKSRDDLWTIAKDVDKTSVNVAQGGTATFNYSVTVTPNGSVDSAYSLTGLVTATNPNDWETVSADLTVTTTVGGGASCSVTGGVGVQVPASGSVSKPYSCTFSGVPSNGSVTGHVAWSAALAATPGSSASATTAATFVIGTETHKTITVVDDKTDPANPVTLGTRDHADGAHTFTYSLSKAGVGGACTSYTNTASISETGQTASKTVTVCVGLDLTVSKTALTTDHRTYLWTIDKDVDKTTQSIAAGGTATYNYSVTVTPSGTTDDGWSVTGDITVTNPNHWQSVTTDVTDSLNTGGGSSCTLAGDDVVVPAFSSVTLHYSCSFASKPADGTNTATATWNAQQYATPSGSATGTASVVFVPTSKTNDTIHVVDDKTDPANPVALGTWNHADGPHTFTYSVDKQGTAGTCTDYTNTASITETEQTATQAVTLCVGSALTMAATSSGSFDRDDLWSITKDVDQTDVTLAEGASSATFTYTVTATPSGFSDSGYALGGTVTATNPNDWEDVVADLAVTTDLGGGAACVVTDGTDVTVPKGGAVVRPYTCTFSSAPALTGSVTATADWDALAAFTPVATASVEVPAELVLDATSHATVTVVDDKTDPGNPVVLGPATWGEDATTFTYSLAKTAADGACTSYTNVATIVETEQSATADIRVCGFTGGGGTITPPAAGGGLPLTGDLTGMLTRWALSLLAAGAVLLLAARRRQA